jgi:hypothetical protein
VIGARPVIPPFRVEFTDEERAEILESFDWVLAVFTQTSMTSKLACPSIQRPSWLSTSAATLAQSCLSSLHCASGWGCR